MFKANLLFIFLLQLNLHGFCQPIRLFLAVPKNAIVRIGANVSFECVVFNSANSANLTNSAFWDFVNVLDSNEIKIYFTAQMKPRYRINNSSKGQFDLVIDSVDHGHAGRYTCTEFSSNSKATAELTVIGSDPVCGINVTNMEENRTISLWCEINSTGSLIPQMKWTKDNGALINDTAQNTTINGLTTTTSFVRLQLVPQDNNEMEGITVKCTTSFMWKNGSTESVPYYLHVWNHTLPLTTERDTTSETDMEASVEARGFTTCAAVSHRNQVTAESNPHQLEAWIIAAVGGSIVIIILIILCLVFQRRKKKGSSKNSSSQSTSNPDVLHHDSLPSNGSNSRNAEESAKAPVQYDAVIYAEVNKEPKKKKPKNHTETKSSSKTAQNKGQAGIIGEDGTVYMDFSGAKQTEAKKAQSKSPQKAQSKSQQFSQVELYACVDHTLFAPPHPPNSANGKK